MTNTYMLAGPHDPQEIIAQVKKGLYAANFGGGQVDITSGKFVFSAAEAYLIENGKVTHPVKGATLIGNGPDVLTRVTMIGNDLAARLRHRHLRQGRPERAGRRRPADAQDRRPHGWRHGLKKLASAAFRTARCSRCRRTIRLPAMEVVRALIQQKSKEPAAAGRAGARHVRRPADRRRLRRRSRVERGVARRSRPRAALHRSGREGRDQDARRDLPGGAHRAAGEREGRAVHAAARRAGLRPDQGARRTGRCSRIRFPAGRSHPVRAARSRPTSRCSTRAGPTRRATCGSAAGASWRPSRTRREADLRHVTKN